MTRVCSFFQSGRVSCFLPCEDGGLQRYIHDAEKMKFLHYYFWYSSRIAARLATIREAHESVETDGQQDRRKDKTERREGRDRQTQKVFLHSAAAGGSAAITPACSLISIFRDQC